MVATDLVALPEALAYLGVTADGGAGDALVGTFITGATAALEVRTGALISRELVALEAGTGPTLTVAAAVTGRQMADAARHTGATVTVGTDLDPWSSSGASRLRAVSATDRTVTLSDAFTVAAGDGLRLGRYLDTATLPENVRLACLHVVRNRWVNEQGVASPDFDATDDLRAVPFVIPWAALELLGDDMGGGWA